MNELITRYLEDRASLTAEELRTLSTHLEEHPAELTELRAQLAMDDLIARRFNEQRAVFVARVKQAAAIGEAGQSRSPTTQSKIPFAATVLQRLGLTGRPRRSWQYAAAMGLIVLLTLAVQGTFHRRYSAQPVELEVLEAADTAASAPVSFSRGARLSLSELRMPSGFLRFRLESGAEVAVTGPAEVELVDSMHLRVRRGRVTADVGDRAKGFVVDTEQTQVVDLGTKFGVDVADAGHTDVIVFKGEVELFDRKDHRQQDAPMTRLVEGEAVRVNKRQQLSRIVNVTSGPRDEEWSTREGRDAGAVIASVRDNLRDPSARNFYRILPNGLQEDARAFVGQRHEWNGLDPTGIPAWLLGADLVQTFMNDRIKTQLEVTVSVARPAVIYLLFDNRHQMPSWLAERFTDTGARIGLENAPPASSGLAVGKGPGIGHMAPCSVWKCELPQGGSITLGPPRQPGDEAANQKPYWNWMYGIAAKPLATK